MASRKRTIEEIVNSDTDSDGSEFDGFSSGSDISVGSDTSDESDSENEIQQAQPPPPVQLDNEWTRHFTPITVEDFTAHTGPNLPDQFDTRTANPIDYFWLLFSAELFNDIARHTNNYARWQMDQRNAQDPYWTETTPNEMRAFIGMEILMGVNQLPDSQMYWSQNPLLGNTGMQKVMTANRYQKLKQYFHVSDRAAEPARGEPQYDRLYKVRPIMDHVATTFLERYDVGKAISVDEAMVKYTGKLSFRQYMPAKPIKRGIKIWMACDSDSSYLSRFQVYLGISNDGTEHGLGYNVVTKLTDNLHGSYRQVYFDNFFTSIPLMETLLENDLYACGTVRVNRKGFPNDLKKPQAVKERGQFMVRQKGRSNLTATVWKDKRLVHHLSTMHEPDDIRAAQRRVGPRVVQLQQPATVHCYKWMGGVDTHDQLRMNYSVGRNSKKWLRYLFWFFVNCALVNSFIIFKGTSQLERKKKKYAHLDYRTDVAMALIGGFTSRKRAVPEVNMNVPLVPAENINGHVLCKLNAPKGRCKWHLMQKIRKETVYGCSQCNVHLCRDGCHIRFHNV